MTGRHTMAMVLFLAALSVEVAIVMAGAPMFTVGLSGAMFVAGANLGAPMGRLLRRLRGSRGRRAPRTSRRQPHRDEEGRHVARSRARRTRHLESWCRAPQWRIDRRLIVIEAEFADMQPLLEELDDADAEGDRACADALPQRTPGKAKSDLDEAFERQQLLESSERQRPADPRRAWRDGEQIVPPADADAVHRAARAILAAALPQDPRRTRRDGTTPVPADAAGPAPSAPTQNLENP